LISKASGCRCADKTDRFRLYDLTGSAHTLQPGELNRLDRNTKFSLRLGRDDTCTDSLQGQCQLHRVIGEVAPFHWRTVVSEQSRLNFAAITTAAVIAHNITQALLTYEARDAAGMGAALMALALLAATGLIMCCRHSTFHQCGSRCCCLCCSICR